MRCKKHVSDQSSAIGVCATCLRERLLTFIRSQTLISEELQPDPIQNDPPALIFPRSVSPYRSGNPTRFHIFYPTPQVDHAHHRRKNPSSSSKSKFGFISKLFRSRSEKFQSLNYNYHHHDYRVAPTAKGMSPVVGAEDSSPARSFPRPSPGRLRPVPARSNSLGFCLSPLVRPSPSRQWSGGGEEKGGGGAHPSLSDARRYCANRSRKLADYGRLNRNR